METKLNTEKSQIKGWLSESEIQELTGFKTTKLWALRKAKMLKSSKIGSRTYYSEESLIKLLEKNADK